MAEVHRHLERSTGSGNILQRTAHKPHDGAQAGSRRQGRRMHARSLAPGELMHGYAFGAARDAGRKGAEEARGLGDATKREGPRPFLLDGLPPRCPSMNTAQH